MVRYVDQPSVEVEIAVMAPVDAVWRLVTDVDLPARFSEEFQGGEWIDGPIGVGARFRGTNRHPAVGEWTTVSTVISYEERRVFAWAVVDVDDPAAVWEFELEPVDDGTRLTMRARMGPGPSGVSAVIEARPDREEEIIARRVEEWRTNMTATLDGIKVLAEDSIS